MTLAPVALFAYNRPAYLRRAVEALRAADQARESTLWIFCDGPKRPQHENDVAQVRAYARTIKGFASVKVVERERNLGLAASITDGVSRLCDEFGRIIVLEDDLLVAPEFLAFMNACLNRYESDERVYQVSGYMYPIDRDVAKEALFLPMISCWGWATWRRAWKSYDASFSAFERLQVDDQLRRRFNLDGAYDYYGMAMQQKQGKIDSWGIRWHLSVFQHDGLVLYPRQSLVQNLGIDGSGTHAGGQAQLQCPLGRITLNPAAIRFPTSVSVDESALSDVKQLLRSMQSPIRRLTNWLKSAI